MARPLRIEYAGALYHVTSRGDRQEKIFEDDEDRRAFLNILGGVVSRYRWRCHAYCLMENHYHLMIETLQANLTKGMRQLNGVFTQWSNRRHKRGGHLFQGRYKAILVDRESYFLELARYIVLNPVRAAMVKHPRQWGWSSYGATAGRSQTPRWLNTDDILVQFGKRRAMAARKYQEFIAEGMGQESIWKDLKGQIYLGDEEFVDEMRAKQEKRGDSSGSGLLLYHWSRRCNVRTMARPLRIEYAGALYHVTSRGDRQETIFEDDEDRRAFLNILGGVVSRYRWRCHAYCLMGNHYHLMIETPQANLTRGMRQLNGVFTQWSNRRHKRSGHLFQGRYKAILVDRESYFLELARYIVLNPVRAAMVKHPRQWGWSSYGATAGRSQTPRWLNTDDILVQFGKRRAMAARKYQEFIAEGMGQESIWNDLRGQIYLGDDDFVDAMRAKQGKRNEDKNIAKVQQRGSVPNLSVIRRQYKDRDDAMRAAYETGAYSYQQIAKEFAVHFTTVGRIVRQGGG